jgi:hypothetical protein
MLINRLWSLFPSWRMLLTAAVSSVLGGTLAIGLADRPAMRTGPNPNPLPDDPCFVALGRAYLPQLGKAYAAAWDDGAKALDAGQAVSAALDAVAKGWTANRTALYDTAITPELAKILPESVKDADVTPAERAALAAAWRGLARGLAQ